MTPNAAAPSFVLQIVRALQIGVSAEFEFSPFLVGAGIALGDANSERRNRRALGQTSFNRSSALGFRWIFIGIGENPADQEVWKTWKVSAALNSRIESDSRRSLWLALARAHHTLVASGFGLFRDGSLQQLINPGGIKGGQTHLNASLGSNLRSGGRRHRRPPWTRIQ
jgi:hypothetical protein